MRLFRPFPEKRNKSSVFRYPWWIRSRICGHAMINTSLMFSRTLVAVASLFLLPAVWAEPAPQSRNNLQVYFVDVEGGQATLFVTPAGQSLLIDTGWPGHDGRGGSRIVDAAGEDGNKRNI